MSAMTKVPLFLAALLLLTRTSAKTTVRVVGLDISTTDSSYTSTSNNEDWRDNTLIYQIWPRSFQDSDGDGQGDLQGIIHRLDYLVELGVDTIRLSSIYSSPQIDSGYDVFNHTDIDPIYGNFNDFLKLIFEAHEKDLKVILDIIPNHSSDQHEWFLSSITNTEPYNDYYIWADGKILNNKVVPPNNWKSSYSNDEGSAWTWHMQRKQWYYHKFHHTEPDLNLRNEDVIQEILDIFDFWLDKGVDGFCICGISYFFENENFDESSTESNNSNHDSDEENDDDDDDDDDDSNDNDDDNDYTVGLSENACLLYRFREHINKWVRDNNDKPKLLMGEVDEDDDEISSYYGNETHDGIIPLNLIFITKLNDSINAKDIKDLIENWLFDVPEGIKTNWMLSNQDYSRAASRLNPNLLDGLYMITLLLPGQAITYYGEEIGMLNTNISRADTIDIKGLEQSEDNYFEYSRDRSRTPMQWDNTTSAGFSTNKTTFLPVNSNYININVKKQLHNPDSNLNAYKKLAILRENPIFTNGDYDLNTVNDDNIFILKRSLNNDTCIAIINFGSSKETVNLTELYPDLEEDLQVMVDSSNANVEKENDEDYDKNIENDSFILAANAAAVLCDRNDFKEFPFETTTNDDSPTDDDDSDDDNNNDDDGDDDSSDSDDSDENEDDDQDDSKTKKPKDLTSSSVEDSESESDAQNSAITKQALLFIIIIHLALVLLLREL